MTFKQGFRLHLIIREYIVKDTIFTVVFQLSFMTSHQHKAAEQDLKMLASRIEGDLFTDFPMRLMYATDASVYREIPLAVIRPKNAEDIKKVVNFATVNCMTVIPRGAGTSLAGQVVGRGLVVDVSRYESYPGI